jgi:transposase-like protein
MRFTQPKAASWRARLLPGDPIICLSRGHSASVIYTTNAIESVNMTLRKVTRNHRLFPSDESAFKVIAPFYPEHR